MVRLAAWVGKSNGGQATAPEDWTHSRTLARGRRRAGDGSVAGFRTAADCQSAMQRIANPMPLGFNRGKIA